MNRLRIIIFIFICINFFISSAIADLVIYPAKGQNKEQQAKDKGVCRDWAIEETGVNPDKLAETSTSVKPQKDAKIAKGAASGALVGGAAGSFSGEFGKGAAIGAAVGAITGILSKGHAKNQAEKQTAENEAKKKELMKKFNKAYAACLESKGYTVK